MSELSTLLFGPRGSKPKPNNSDQLARLLFGKDLGTLNKRDLGAIAERIFWRVEYYHSPAKKSRKELVALVTEYIGEVEKPHPITGNPMIEHRHFGDELNRLLALAHEIRTAIKTRTAADDLAKRLHELARQSVLAAGAAKTTKRPRQADWIDPVIKRANELARERPKPNTSKIAEKIASDPVANPYAMSADTIRKVLNEGKLR